LAGLPPALLQDVTNTATWTATDGEGTQLSRTDQVTVKVVIPLTGHVFYDLNGDGMRNSNETTGLGSVTVSLEPMPADPQRFRQATSDVTGYYEFLDAVEGDYTVSAQIPAGYVATSPVQVPATLVFGVNKVVNFGVQAASPTPTQTATPTITSTPTDGPSPTATTPLRRMYLPVLVHVPAGLQPPPPPSLQPVTSPGQAATYLISWTPVGGATGYAVQRSPSPSFDQAAAIVYAGTGWSFNMRSSGIGTFYHRVRAENAAGASEWSEVRSADMSWEAEPNNMPAQATGGVVSGQVVYALPDDVDDFFRISVTQPGLISASLADMAGIDVRLALYYDNIGNGLAADTTAPYSVTAYGQPGDYYVRIFVGAAHTDSTPYRLVATYK
jgi:hypothetical protein